jgi:putative addiction module CopG family antidote
MLHRNVKLPPESLEFFHSRIESGRYENAGAVLQAALQALDREEKSSMEERSMRSIAESDVFRSLWDASSPTSPLTRDHSVTLR